MIQIIFFLWPGTLNGFFHHELKRLLCRRDGEETQVSGPTQSFYENQEIW